MRGEDKYEYLGEVIEGGMGRVYKVRHRELNAVRAIKEIRGPLASDRRLRERFKLEARTVAPLRHPHLVQLYDFDLDEDGSVYMVLDWIDGLNFSQLVGHSMLPPLVDALDIAEQALSALGYLHRQGIIHRDVSADNFMVTCEEGERLIVKLIDLGIAKRADAADVLTEPGWFLGKLAYAAPEVLDARRSAGPPDHRSDLYSFGVVLYELLTGKSPVAGDSRPEVVAGHLQRSPLPFNETDPSGRVPKALRDIVLRALEKCPENRFQSAAEFATALSTVRPTAAGELEQAAELRRTVATSRLNVEYATSESVQRRLARRFGARRKSELLEDWFRKLRETLPLRKGSSSASRLVEVARTLPRPVAVGTSAVLLVVLVIGFAGLSRSTVTSPAEPATSAESGSDEAVEQRGESGQPGEGVSAQPHNDPAATAPSPADPVPLRVVLISDDARLATTIQDRLDPRIEVVIRSSLGGVDGSVSLLAIEASTDLRQSSVEAYETMLPACEAAVTGRLLEIPGGRSLFARTITRTAPRCGGALDEAARLLAEELAPRTLEILRPR